MAGKSTSLYAGADCGGQVAQIPLFDINWLEAKCSSLEFLSGSIPPVKTSLGW
jgi:hypothetical protein